MDLPGTIITYAGRNIPQGYLPCDGSVQNKRNYPVLYTHLGTIWGSGDGSPGSFNLPDLRGMFLRGVDGSAGKDPDKVHRIAFYNGGATGNNVGSYQPDSLAAHNHKINRQDAANTGGGGGMLLAEDNINGTAKFPSQDSSDNQETRPKNANVYYIIKAQ